MSKKPNLFAAFDRAMKSAPDGSRKAQFDHFMETVRSNPAYLEVLATEYFDQMARQWKVRNDGKSVSLVATAPHQRRVEISTERRAERIGRVIQARDDLKTHVRTIVLLDLTLPSGKKLRDATGAECAKAGGFYTEVARHVKPSQVVDKHLNEADLRNIQARYEGGKRRNAPTAEMRVGAP